MRTCPECGAEWPDDTLFCTTCGTAIDTDFAADADDPMAITNADFDQEAERERFESRYGIDIGDRTVDEFLEHLSQQDFTITPWFWIIVVAEIAWIGLFTFTQFGPGGWELVPIFLGVSAILSLSVLGDTRAVGQFRKWSKTRWTYIILTVIPFYGQIAGFLYIILRRLQREEAEKHRRRLFEAGFDIDL